MTTQAAQVIAVLGLVVGLPAWLFVRAVLASSSSSEASTATAEER